MKDLITFINLKVMKPEELAYINGFRVYKDGKLFNLNGRKYKTDLSTGKERFFCRRNKFTHTIYISRMQAFQKFGKELFEFNGINFLNLNPLDCSYDNIELGKGSELVTPELEKLHKTKRAYELGFRVDPFGNLRYNHIEINDKTFLNKFGYKMFSVPFQFKQMQQVFVHRLQAYQKYGEELFKTECVRHLDGNCINNTWKNIAIGTFKDNSNDISSEYKKKYYLERSPKIIKYPVEFRNKLRKEFKKGDRVWDLHLKYNMPYNSVRYIVKGKSLV